jgi:hypothetical protein
MKVTLMTQLAGPAGTAKPGTVLDMPTEQAEQLLKARAARMFDKLRDAKAPVGLVKPQAIKA